MKLIGRRNRGADVIAEAKSWSIHRTPHGVALYHNGKRVMHFGTGRDLLLAVEGGQRVVYLYDLKPDEDFGTARYYVKTINLGSIS